MSSDAHHKLCRALTRYHPGAALISAHERPWASITFEGARHWLEVVIPRAGAATFVRDLPEADLPLCGHIVADLVVVRQRPHPGGIALTIEALTVEDC
ncbi:MAG: hypothetical protein KGN98_00520 [Alphaproteobacteria bacterium]|nr:hypothetical protein [Alphaproteobacteria bacterium]